MSGVKLSTFEKKNTTILKRIGHNIDINGKYAEMSELMGSRCNPENRNG